MTQWFKFLALIVLLNACSKNINVQISDAWVRASAPGQSVGAAYMTLESPQDSTLVAIESAAASSVAIHSMHMQDGVMKMRMLDTLALKAGKPEMLSPSGMHLMLIDLKKSLKAGETVSFKLHFKDKANKITLQTVTLPVKEN